MAYIATFASAQGFDVGVLDAEALGLGVKETYQLVNRLGPRWAGFNLLASTYEVSAEIAAGLDRDIMVMVGGHQAKAMPAAPYASLRGQHSSVGVEPQRPYREPGVRGTLADHHVSMIEPPPTGESTAAPLRIVEQRPTARITDSSQLMETGGTGAGRRRSGGLGTLR